VDGLTPTDCAYAGHTTAPASKEARTRFLMADWSRSPQRTWRAAKSTGALSENDTRRYSWFWRGAGKDLTRPAVA
jgi:hypothetical protein